MEEWLIYHKMPGSCSILCSGKPPWPFQHFKHGTLGIIAAVCLAQCFSKHNCLELKQIETLRLAFLLTSNALRTVSHWTLYQRYLPIPGTSNNSGGGSCPYKNSKVHSLVSQTMFYSSGRWWSPSKLLLY